jgi:hypothetical protein
VSTAFSQSMRVSLLDTTSREWTDVLHRVPHDVYHFPQYAAMCARAEGGLAQAFVVQDRAGTFFVPFIVRDVPEEMCQGRVLRDVTVPYGYPGPLASRARGVPEADWQAFLKGSLDAFMANLRERQVVSAFFRLHPILSPDLEVLDQFGAIVPSGNTVAIDLTLSEEALWRQMRSNHRRDVSKAQNRGWVADVDETWRDLEAFARAYRETMVRVGANPYYLFDGDYYADLRSALGPHVHLWTVRARSDVVAGVLFTECGGVVQYHLGGTLDAFLPGNPLKFLFHRAGSWFKARGNRWLHLGGGVGGAQDSLMHFKLGFSSRTFPFHTWRVIVDMSMYEALSNTSSAVRTVAFFPAYRQLTSSGPLGGVARPPDA